MEIWLEIIQEKSCPKIGVALGQGGWIIYKAIWWEKIQKKVVLKGMDHLKIQKKVVLKGMDHLQGNTMGKDSEKKLS